MVHALTRLILEMTYCCLNHVSVLTLFAALLLSRFLTCVHFTATVKAVEDSLANFSNFPQVTSVSILELGWKMYE